MCPSMRLRNSQVLLLQFCKIEVCGTFQDRKIQPVKQTMKSRPATKPSATMILLLVLLLCRVHHAEAKTGKQPTLAPTQEPFEYTFPNETIDFVNVENLPDEDVDDLFVRKKDWFEKYYREQVRRWMQRRHLQDRLRDSSDITTEFEFMAQNVTYSMDGIPTNQITYNQVIGFGPGRRRLIEINIDDINEVYQVATSIYWDAEAVEELAETLREEIPSFSSLETIVKFVPPDLVCGRLCQELRRSANTP